MWQYFGTWINTITVILGSCIGLLLKKCDKNESGRLDAVSKRMMFCLGLCTIFASVSGLTGINSGKQALVVVLSMVLGLLIGMAIKIDDRLNALGNRLTKIDGDERTAVNPAAGFVTACLLFCTGSMTILGAFEGAANPAGYLTLSAHTTLLIKSLLDFVSAACLASAYGLTVLFSAGFVLIFQSLLTLLASFVYPFLTALNVLPLMNCTGALILIAIALNLMEIKKVKTSDFLPALFLPVLICWILSYFGIIL